MDPNNFFPVKVADPDGTTYTWQTATGLTVEDRNGNTVVVTEDLYHRGHFSETDTLGRVISSSGFGASFLLGFWGERPDLYAVRGGAFRLLRHLEQQPGAG
jgi:hypothetical protein